MDVSQWPAAIQKLINSTPEEVDHFTSTMAMAGLEPPPPELMAQLVAQGGQGAQSAGTQQPAMQQQPPDVAKVTQGNPQQSPQMAKPAPTPAAGQTLQAGSKQIGLNPYLGFGGK